MIFLLVATYYNWCNNRVSGSIIQFTLNPIDLFLKSNCIALTILSYIIDMYFIQILEYKILEKTGGN